jgi:FemAB-related protein (PEP-CTERM system-associated)
VTLEVSLAGPDQDAAWDAFVRASPGGDHCHLTAWRRVVERAYGHSSFYLWAREDGVPRGVLPLVHLRSRLFARRLVSMPFLDDGGACAEEPAVARALADEAVRLAHRLRVDVLDLRHRRPSGLDLAPHGAKVTFRLDLIGGASALWARLDAKVRNQVRKGQKSGLAVEWTGRDGVADFYDVFAVNMRDLGSPVHDRRFFEALLGELPDEAGLAIVRHDGRPIAGAVCLSFRETVHVPWASSLRAFRGLCANNVLYWEIMSRASEEGRRWLDFGRSTRGSGTYHFKRQWGAREEPLHWQCLTRGSGNGALIDSSEGRYGLAARVWSRLPVALTRLVGPAIRGHLSN